MAIVENAGEDLITDEDLQGTPEEVLGKLAQKVSLDFWDISLVHIFTTSNKGLSNITSKARQINTVKWKTFWRCKNTALLCQSIYPNLKSIHVPKI